jgi:hypothetical protein
LTPPQLERFRESLSRQRRLPRLHRSPTGVGVPLKFFEIDLVRVQSQLVASGPTQKYAVGRTASVIRFQGLPEVGNVSLQDTGGRRRRLITPEELDEAGAQNSPICLQKKNRQDSSLLAGTDGNHSSVPNDFQRPEEAEFRRHAAILDRHTIFRSRNPKGILKTA